MIVKQICYYDETGIKKNLNNPPELTAHDLTNGLLLTDIIYDEVQIKTFPGIFIEINGQEVIIGETGIYNILYKENVKILTIRVNPESVKLIQKNDDAFLIITAMKND